MNLGSFNLRYGFKFSIKILLGLVFFSSLLAACKKDDQENNIIPISQQTSNTPTPYHLQLPAHFSLIPKIRVPEENPMTMEGVALGKKLYYEQKLSKGGPLEGFACASCHIQDQSFSSNHSPFNQVIPHFNLAWSNQFLWEGKVEGDLEDVMLFEVDDFFQSDLSGIKTDPEYKELYNLAFANEEINSIKTAYALAQFVRTLISGNSRYDKYVKEVLGIPYQGTQPMFTAEELNGMELYFDERKGDCFHCHGGTKNPLLTNNDYVNNGLDALPDSGLAAYTKRPADLGKFKTPSLRNLVFTAPYMHDGRFQTLREVIDFYADQVQIASPNIDGLMRKPRSLSPSEREDLVAFLKTMTDSSFIQNSSFRP